MCNIEKIRQIYQAASRLARLGSDHFLDSLGLVLQPQAILLRNSAIVIIDTTESRPGLDAIADLVLNRTIGETLGAAVGVD
jgi:hypothetical protein